MLQLLCDSHTHNENAHNGWLGSNSLTIFSIQYPSYPHQICSIGLRFLVERLLPQPARQQYPRQQCLMYAQHQKRQELLDVANSWPVVYWRHERAWLWGLFCYLVERCNGRKSHPQSDPPLQQRVCDWCDCVIASVFLWESSQVKHTKTHT